MFYRLGMVLGCVVLASCGSADVSLSDRLVKAESDCVVLVSDANWKTGGAEASTYCNCMVGLLAKDEPINAEAISHTLTALSSEHQKTGDPFKMIKKRVVSAGTAPGASQQEKSLSIGLDLAEKAARKARSLAKDGRC